jgi:hypothetical protein
MICLILLGFPWVHCWRCLLAPAAKIRAIPMIVSKTSCHPSYMQPCKVKNIGFLWVRLMQSTYGMASGERHVCCIVYQFKVVNRLSACHSCSLMLLLILFTTGVDCWAEWSGLHLYFGDLANIITVMKKKLLASQTSSPWNEPQNKDPSSDNKGSQFQAIHSVLLSVYV